MLIPASVFSQQVLDDELIVRGLKAVQTEIPLPFDTLLRPAIIDLSTSRDDMLVESFQQFLNLSLFLERQIEIRGLPAELRYLPLAVSGMQPDFTGSFNRAGIWGLTAAVAVANGLRITPWWDERFDPELSTRVALNHINELYMHYSDWWLTIIAFTNGRSGLANVFIRMDTTEAGIFDIFRSGGLPVPEIIPDFITGIFTVHYILPEKGLTPVTNLIVVDTINLREPIYRYDLLRVCGMNADTFRLLNPVYISSVLIPHPSLPLKVSAEGKEKFLALQDSLYLWFSDTTLRNGATDSLVNESLPPLPQYTTHVVRQGDMLGVIARNFGVGVEQIKRWNNLKNDTIYPGQHLKIYSRNE